MLYVLQAYFYVNSDKKINENKIPCPLELFIEFVL